MEKFALTLSFIKSSKDPDGVLLLVDMAGRTEIPVWFQLFCGETMVQESENHGFYCTEPGTYFAQGVLRDGSKVKTQTIEVTRGMVAAAARGGDQLPLALQH